jgi:hypothetical protein
MSDDKARERKARLEDMGQFRNGIASIAYAYIDEILRSDAFTIIPIGKTTENYAHEVSSMLYVIGENVNTVRMDKKETGMELYKGDIARAEELGFVFVIDKAFDQETAELVKKFYIDNKEDYKMTNGLYISTSPVKEFKLNGKIA